MGIKEVMTPEELMELLKKTACPPEIQAKIVGDYSHLYGFIEGIEMFQPDEQKRCGLCIFSINKVVGREKHLTCINKKSKQCGHKLSFQGLCDHFKKDA